MRKSGLLFLLVSFCPLVFGQLDPNSITVSVSQNATLQPDQAVFGVVVQSGISTGLDDVLAALQGSGITAANFSGVSTQGQTISLLGAPVLPGDQVPAPTLSWAFSLPVPLTKTKDTVASLTTLQQNITKVNNGLTLSFSIAGTEVSQQLAQSQTCSLSGLIANATTQAQSLAAAANLTVGRILALSSATANTAFNPGGLYSVLGSVSFSSISAPCAITVKFALTGY